MNERKVNYSEPGKITSMKTKIRPFDPFFWFFQRYEIIATDRLGPESKNTFVGTPGMQSNRRKCRFCDRDNAPSTPIEKRTTFRMKAHAFPELIGNKSLVDKNECDQCNRHFAQRLENDFGHWTAPWRSAWRVRGKGMPSYKSTDGKIKIKFKDGHQILIASAGDRRVICDDEKKSISLLLERKPFVPMAVFKTLVKMAMAVMPQEKAPRYEHLKEWLLQEQHSLSGFSAKSLVIHSAFMPGPLPPDEILYFLLCRKPDALLPKEKPIPRMQFIFCFCNLVLQIALPEEGDENLLEQYQLQRWPTARPSTIGDFDMSGTQAIQPECLLEMSYHKMEETDVSEAQKLYDEMVLKSDVLNQDLR